MLIKNNIYDDIRVKGFSKIKLFNKNDINNFKKQIVNILNRKKFIKKKIQY